MLPIGSKLSDIFWYLTKISAKFQMITFTCFGVMPQSRNWVEIKKLYFKLQILHSYFILEFGSVIRILRISVGFSGFISVQSGYQFIRIIIRISGYYPLSVGYLTDFRIICITLVTFIVPARIIAWDRQINFLFRNLCYMVSLKGILETRFFVERVSPKKEMIILTE